MFFLFFLTGHFECFTGSWLLQWEAQDQKDDAVNCHCWCDLHCPYCVAHNTAPCLQEDVTHIWRHYLCPSLLQAIKEHH